MGLFSFKFLWWTPKNASFLQHRSRSSEVVDFGTNRSGACEFLLVINSNFGHVLHRFWDKLTTTYWLKIVNFSYTSLIYRPHSGWTLSNFWMNFIYSIKYTLHIPLKTCRETQPRRPKCHQIIWSLGLCPGPHWGSLQRSPSPRPSCQLSVPHSLGPVGPRTSAIRAERLRPFGPRFHPAPLPSGWATYLKIPSYGPAVKMNKIHSLRSMIYSLKARSHNHRMVFSICLYISFAK